MIGTALWILFLVVAGLFVWWLWSRMAQGGAWPGWWLKGSSPSGRGWPGGPGQKSTLDILRRRYARGEITAEQYREMRRELESGGPAQA